MEEIELEFHFFSFRQYEGVIKIYTHLAAK